MMAPSYAYLLYCHCYDFFRRFVSFSEPAEAELALLCMDGFRIHGKKLKVSYKRRVPAPEAAESETYSEQTHLEETND